MSPFASSMIFSVSLLDSSRTMPPTASPSSSPSGATEGVPSPPSPGNGRGDESAASTEVEEPEFPYGGFTWAELGIVGGVCVLLGLISFLGNLYSPCCSPTTQAEMVRSAGRNVLNTVLWGLVTLPLFWACVRLRPRSLGWGVVVGGHVLLAASAMFAIYLGYYGINMMLITLLPPTDPSDPPVFQPIEIFLELRFLNLLGPYLLLLVVGLGRYRYLRSWAHQEHVRRLQREAERLQSQLMAARLKSLRMQINPHFFHNTLHTISTMAGRDPEGIRTATARLSNLMRYVLSTSDQQEIPLKKELDVLDSYLDIQKLRLGERLDVTKDIDPAAREALVPTLVLQPLVENAVKHGFEGTDEIGRLHVEARREGEELVLKVADNGGGLSKDAPIPEDGLVSDVDGIEDGHGLRNIAERLEGLYEDAASLRFDESEGGGLQVTIRLPFRTRDSKRNLRATGVVAE